MVGKLSVWSAPPAALSGLELEPEPPAAVSAPVQAPGGASWVLLSAGALALLGAATPAQPQEYRGVVIVDDFAHADQPGVTTHGELVQIALGPEGCPAESESGVAREHVSLGVSIERAESDLDGYVRERFRVPLEGTVQALQRQLAAGGRAVLGQSQGASESRVVESLWNKAQHDAEFRAALEAQLGEGALLQKLVDRVHEVRLEDQGLAALRHEVHELGARLDQAGLIRVMSAGNQGALARTARDLGVTLPPDFFTNDLADPATILVGAADGDQAAAIASPDAGALVSADAVDRNLCVEGKVERHTGSSYAQPQVSRRVDEMLRENPGLTRAEVEARLVAAARPVPGAEGRLGAGIIP